MVVFIKNSVVSNAYFDKCMDKLAKQGISCQKFIGQYRVFIDSIDELYTVINKLTSTFKVTSLCPIITATRGMFMIDFQRLEVGSQKLEPHKEEL